MDALRVGAEVREALATGAPVVALESTVITHGLPAGDNLRIAGEVEDTVRAHGAVPATIAVIDGTAVVGLTEAERYRLAEAATTSSVDKAGSRDLPFVIAEGRTASTTVGATCVVARRAGIDVFATGGIGGVHVGAARSFDESADLIDLARTGRLVVSAGVKSILDMAATMERLETLGVAVVGYRTDTVPGFWVAQTELPIPRRIDDADTIARAFRLRTALGLDPRSLLVFRPVDEESALATDLHDRIVAEALAQSAGVTGQAATPSVLARIHEQSSGASVRANAALLLGNAGLAADLARALVDDRRD